MYARPAALFTPPLLFTAYGARRFHLAEPELNGFGVTTSIPGFSRSSQSWMPFGLPLRTTMVTTEPKGMPLYWLAFQSLATRPASTRRVMSGSTEKLTKSALAPAATLRDWSPDAP